MQSPVAVAALMEIAKTRTRGEEGQDLLEYGLLMALIALVAMAGVSQVGKTIYDVFWQAIANNF
jgi:Flp pilus assembly pilin Flp